MTTLTDNNENLVYPGLTRAKIKGVAELNILTSPQIDFVGNRFIPSFELAGIRITVRKLNGEPATYKRLEGCRDFICSLGFQEFQINEQTN